MKSLYLYIGGTVIAVAVSAVLAWFIFTSSPAQTGSNANQSVTYGSTDNNATSATFGSATTGGASGGSAQGSAQPVTQGKVFKLSDGPVAGATFVETHFPTTTLARFVMADNGHAYDLALDVQGAVAKPLSNTTIPGPMSARWLSGSALMQYLDGATIKTVYLGLPAAGASTAAAVRLQFLPDGIASVAASPDGTGTAYLLRTQSGVDGYVANADGTGGKKLFSLPLSQVTLAWPAKGALLAYSNPAAGVPGIAFSVDVKSGSVTPLLSASGLSANADSSFEHVVYESMDGSTRRSFDHDILNGAEQALSFTPNPEQCVASPLSATVLVCAVPLSYVAPDFLDGWHQGTASAADSLVAYDLVKGTSVILATPGSAEDGGIATDMLQIAVSPDGRYALFVSKYDRSLWAVRLAQ